MNTDYASFDSSLDKRLSIHPDLKNFIPQIQQGQADVTEHYKHYQRDILRRIESQSSQLEGNNTVDNGFIDTAISNAIIEIQRNYRFLESREMSLETYLYINPEIIPAIIDTRSKLPQYFGDECEMGLVLFDDPEEEHRVLCIRVETALSPQELITKRFEFHKQWFKQYPISIRQLLAIYLDPK